MKRMLMLAAIALSSLFSQGAVAQDGCAVALCLAGQWDKLPQSTACVPPVKAALRRMALGLSFPTCHTSSAGTATVPGGSMDADEKPTTIDTCPPWFTIWVRGDEYGGCLYKGIISVQVNGVAWTDVFWNTSGGTVTHYYPAAVDALKGDVDPTYAYDEAHYHPPKPTGPER